MTLPTRIGYHPSTRFNVGDVVSCDWKCSGRVTQHRIVAKKTHEWGSQTGTVFRVEPAVQHYSESDLRFARDVGAELGWLDAAWFFKDGLELP